MPEAESDYLDLPNKCRVCPEIANTYDLITNSNLNHKFYNLSQ